MISYFNAVKVDYVRDYAHNLGGKVVKYGKESPLWLKLTVGTCALTYIYIRIQWTQLNGCGVDIIQPKLRTFGTLSHYLVDDGYYEFAKKELLDKNRTSVGYYRGMSSIILTTDAELLKKIMTTHFASFPTRNPFSGSVGAGPIFGYTLDILSDMARWKRLRSTLSAGFSTKNLNEMIQPMDDAIEKFSEQLKGLNGQPIDAKIMASKFAVDTFTTAAFSTNVTNDVTDVTKFDEIPIISHMLGIMDPGILTIIPVLIPYGGSLMDALGVSVFNSKSMSYFKMFCETMMNDRIKNRSGRSRDFLNLMADNQILESEMSSATRGMTRNEIIGQLFVFFAAGYETTSSTLMCIILMMIRNPKYVEKIREEADRLLESGDLSTHSLSEESIPWTCAILDETLRLVPAVGMHIRVATLSGDLHLDGITFRNGTSIETSLDLLHTHPDIWDKPNEFYPERFVENPNLKKSTWYLPFGNGPRNCIGMRLALIEIRLGLIRLFSKFEISFENGFVDDVKLLRTAIGMLKPSKSIKIVFNDRKQ